MPNTVAELLAWCREQRGYTECPRDSQGRCVYTGHTGPGRNHQRYAVDAHLTNGTYWCGAYTAAGLLAVHAKVPDGVLTLSTRANMAAWKNAGRWVEPASIVPGDVVFMHLTGRNGTDHSIPDHTGFAIAGPDAGREVHSEGNTSAGDHGSQDNGGGVYERTRNAGVIIGAGRPDWAPSTPAPSPSPQPQEDDMPPIIYADEADPATDGTQVLADGVGYVKLTTPRAAEDAVAAGAKYVHVPADRLAAIENKAI